MNESKKQKTIGRVLNFEKRINATKVRLDSLEDQKKKLVAFSVYDEMETNGLTLSDFFDMVDKREKGGKNKPIEKTDEKIITTFNGGKQE